MNNAFAFLLILLYIFAIIGTAEFLRRWRNYPTDFTRKVVHIGVGMLSWALPFLFDTYWPFLLGCALFVVITWLDWRYGWFLAMASKERQNLGTVYFPIAAAAVALFFWDTPPLMVAALMPLTWGDGLAPVVGRAYGRHPYTVFGHTRTYQGSVGFFVGGLLFTWLALWLMPGAPQLAPLAALPAALVISLATSLTEAVSVRGLDNLTITAVAILILSIWPF